VVDALVNTDYDLHSVGLVQPAPSGRSTAVQIETTGNPLFVEARQKVDQYDGPNYWSAGIASEGVIVYELAGEQNPAGPPDEIDPLIRLLTQTALRPGQSITTALGVTVKVLAELPGGFRVRIENPTAPSVVVPDLRELSPALAESWPRGEVHGTELWTLVGVQPVPARWPLRRTRQHGDDGSAHGPYPLNTRAL
jgi:hypothetical protein